MSNTFEMNKDLLRSVIFKQAGTIQKALIECFQNSIDAEATEISLNINKNCFTFTDNGFGMSKNDVDKYFKIFGNSSKKNSNKIGKFGIGRGQLFAFGFVSWKTNNNSMFINVKKRLGYTHNTTKNIIKGTQISCMLYDKIDSWKVSSILSDIKQLVLPVDFKLTLNNEIVDFQENILYENDDFQYIESETYNVNIYSQNLLVKRIESIFDYKINCKVKMDLNFARNEFIEQTESTKSLKKFIHEIETKLTIKKPKFDRSEALKVLKQISKNEIDINLVKHKKLLKLPNGKTISINELNGKEILFGANNRNSDRALESGYLVLSDNQKEFLEILLQENKISFSVNPFSLNQLFPNVNHKETDVKSLKNKKEVLLSYVLKDMNYEIFNDKREILLGISDSAIAWTDGFKKIWFNVDYLDENNTKKFIGKAYETLVHEYAHDSASFNEIDHSADYNKDYRDLNVKYMSKFTNYLLTFKLSTIKNDYYHDIDDSLYELTKKLVGKKMNILVSVIKRINSTEFSNKDIKVLSDIDFHNQINNLIKKDILRITSKIGQKTIYRITGLGQDYF